MFYEEMKKNIQYLSNIYNKDSFLAELKGNL
jgi:hypothetical protein